MLVLDELRASDYPEIERGAARFLDDLLAGVGPKQSRNLLQELGLTRYEVPIDSRMAAWLGTCGFPLLLNSGVLGEKDWYEFILDGLQELCRKSGVYPCVLDAAVFASRNKNASTDANIVK
jgi:hypothetical protein